MNLGWKETSDGRMIKFTAKSKKNVFYEYQIMFLRGNPGISVRLVSRGMMVYDGDLTGDSVEKKTFFPKTNGVAEAKALCQNYEDSSELPDGDPPIDFLLRWLQDLGIEAKLSCGKGKTFQVTFYRDECRYEGYGLSYYEALRDVFFFTQSKAWEFGVPIKDEYFPCRGMD